MQTVPARRPVRLLSFVLFALLSVVPCRNAVAQALDMSLLEPGCRVSAAPVDSDPFAQVNALTCGGPFISASGVHLFSGEFSYQAVDLRIRGRGMDFVWARTYRSRIGSDRGIGTGWSHAYDIRLNRITDGPSEAQSLRFPGASSLEWDPPASPAGLASQLAYCTLRSSQPFNFASPATTVILDPEQPDTTTTDNAVPAPGEFFSYLILPKNGNRAGSLGTDSSGTPRVGLTCGVTGPDLVLHDGTGRQDLYSLQANGKWTAPEFFREITENPDGTHTIILPDTARWQFLPFDGTSTAGRIQAIVDRNANRISFDYDASGRLTRVTDTLGRDILVGYDVNGFLATVTDFIGRQVRYDYYTAAGPDGTFGDMMSATGPAVTGTPNGNDFPAGKTTAYTYSTGHGDARLNHNLLTIVDPKGQVYLHNRYASSTDALADDFDRVVSQIWGGPGERIDYFYRPVAPDATNGFATKLTIENDRVGNVTDFYFDSANRLVMRREFTGRAPDPAATTTDTTNRPTAQIRPVNDPPWFETSWQYTRDARAVLTILPNLNEIQLTFDSLNPERRSQGNPLEHCRLPGPLGGTQTQICESFEFDDGPIGANFPTLHVDGRGNPTVHQYDAAGNRLQTVHRLTSIVEDFEYNSFGQLTAHTLPDNGSGHRRRDEFTYYTGEPQAGYRESATIDETAEALATTFTYDAAGNLTGWTDPKGNDAQFVVNQLDQVLRTITREVGPGGARYEIDLFYDANDNLVRRDVQNVDHTGSVAANTHFTTVYEYDELDFLTRRCREAGPYTGTIPGTPTLPSCAGLPFGEFLHEEYAYDANRNWTLIRLGEAVNGNQPENGVEKLYDERDLLYREIRAPGSADRSTTQIDYDVNGNVTRVSQGLEGTPHVQQVVHDGYDRLVERTDAMGNVTSFEYDANGNVLGERIDGELVDIPGGAGNVRLWQVAREFDVMNRPRSIGVAHFDAVTQAPILDGLSTTILDWSDASQLVQRTDDNGNPTTVDYDTVNRVAVVTDALGNSMTAQYDANSNVTSRTSLEKSDLGALDETYQTGYRYDGLDRLVSVEDNVGNLREAHYDSRNNRTREFDSLRGASGTGNVAHFTYDGINRLTRTEYTMTSDGTGAGTPTGTIDLGRRWDDSSRLASRTDDKGNSTSYEYDALNRLVRTANADGTADSTDYNVHHFPTKRVDANGTQSDLTRDLNDRLLRRVVTPAPGVVGTTFESFVHDGLSRVVEAQDDDSVVQLAHDSMSSIISETLNGATTGRSHDGMGNRLQSVYPGGRTTDFTFDPLNRLATILEGATTIASYDYVGPGRVERRTHANRTQLIYEYDGLTNAPGDSGVKRAVSTLHESPIATIDERIYRWDGMFDKTLAQDVTPGGPGRGRDYGYDSRYRLTRTDLFEAAGPLGTTRYTLDGVGNRTGVAGGPAPGAYAMDPALPEPADEQMNQYTTTSFDDREYDPNGDLLVLDPGTAAQREMAYDYADQMVSFTDVAAAVTATFQYDAFGRRFGRTVADPTGSRTTNYFYDGWRVCEEQDAAGTVEATYVYGRDLDEVLTMRRGADDFYYHGDEQHNVVAVTDASGNVLERYDYEDYGQPTILGPAWNPIAGSTIGNPYLFNGRRYDPETGMYYYRTRYLDPRAGRFTTRDTIGAWGDPSGIGNAFTFAGSNPATHEDPMGEAIYLHIEGLEGDVRSAGWKAGRYFVADSFSFGVEREMKESGEKGGTEDINIGVGELQECAVGPTGMFLAPTLGGLRGSSIAMAARNDRDYFVADSFSFGVEREMKESGEKGGTEDINIGIGELQECTISKSMDENSPKLAQFAINGNSCGTAEIDFEEVAGGGDGSPQRSYLRYKLQPAYIKSWSTSGDADDRPTEEVAFYYNKIAFEYRQTMGGVEFPSTQSPGFLYRGYAVNPDASTEPCDENELETVSYTFQRIDWP